MVVDPVSRPSRDLARDGAQTEVADLDGAVTAGADHVVVVGRNAGHVGVLAGGAIEAFHGPHAQQQVDRAEDRRPPDAQAAGSNLGDQVGGVKVDPSRPAMRSARARRGDVSR
jgi:hypothetical protein